MKTPIDTKRNNSDNGEKLSAWDVFLLLTTAEFGKQYYFRYNDGTVFSRLSGRTISFESAIVEFVKHLTE